MSRVRSVTRHPWLASGWAKALIAVVAPLVAALILIPFRDHLANAAAALVLVAVVVAVASLGSRLAGYLAAVSATIWFDFFLTQPYERLAITHRHDIETAVGLLVVGIAVTEIAVRSRQHREEATVAIDYVTKIYDVSALAAGSSNPGQVVEKVRSELVALLNLRDCRFEEVPPAGRGPQLDASGEVVNAGLRWPVDDVGLPGPALEVAVRHGGRSYGRFVMTPTPGDPVDHQSLRVAVLLCNEIGSVMSDRDRLTPPANGRRA
jgi:Domain of unknown function (DUF4118)